MNLYNAWYGNKQTQVKADTPLKAQEIAATRLNAKKRWEVCVVIVGEINADGSIDLVPLPTIR